MTLHSKTSGIVEPIEDVILNCIFVQVIQGDESISGGFGHGAAGCDHMAITVPFDATPSQSNSIFWIRR